MLWKQRVISHLPSLLGIDDQANIQVEKKTVVQDNEHFNTSVCLEQMKQEKWIKHYSSSQKILLVGEGDFSFSASLADAFCSASNIVATSLDNRATVLEKHSTAWRNLQSLEFLNCVLVHEVDAHTMNTHPLLRTKKFDRIVFNFPHAGFHYFYQECDKVQIMLHQEVVRGFFKSASKMLTKQGEVHVTHKTANPFCKWEIPKLAEEFGLCLIEEAPFTKFDYPGYHNKKGHGRKSNKTFRVGQCSTFKFSLPKSHVSLL